MQKLPVGAVEDTTFVTVVDTLIIAQSAKLAVKQAENISNFALIRTARSIS